MKKYKCHYVVCSIKKAGVSQYQHVQGEVNSIGKLDKHYYGLFGFIALKNEDIWTYSPFPESSIKIRNALIWLRENNFLYSNFFFQL